MNGEWDNKNNSYEILIFSDIVLEITVKLFVIISAVNKTIVVIHSLII